MNLSARAEMLGRIEDELKSEMAASLGRIGRKLESLIQELWEIRRLDVIHEETRKQYSELHQQARLYYWYLVV